MPTTVAPLNAPTWTNFGSADVVRLGIEEGVLLNATGPATIRFAPALTLTEAEANEALDKFTRALNRVDVPVTSQPDIRPD